MEEKEFRRKAEGLGGAGVGETSRVRRMRRSRSSRPASSSWTRKASSIMITRSRSVGSVVGAHMGLDTDGRYKSWDGGEGDDSFTNSRRFVGRGPCVEATCVGGTCPYRARTGLSDSSDGSSVDWSDATTQDRSRHHHDHLRHQHRHQHHRRCEAVLGGSVEGDLWASNETSVYEWGEAHLRSVGETGDDDERDRAALVRNAHHPGQASVDCEGHPV